VHFAAFFLELHDAIGERIQGEISAHANVTAGVHFRATLTDNDVTGDTSLSTIQFYTTILRVTVAAVTAAGLAFLMGHCPLSKYKVLQAKREH
jgi:hypothetical protein